MKRKREEKATENTTKHNSLTKKERKKKKETRKMYDDTEIQQNATTYTRYETNTCTGLLTSQTSVS